MQSKARPLPMVKSYRLFDGDDWREAPVPSPESKVRSLAEHNAFPNGRWTATARCYAYKPDGAICHAPAQFLDLQRGGMVCAEHHRETEGL